MKGIYIIGTDTGVGKTMVSAAIVAALLARGIDAAYMKPVASDGEEHMGRLVSPDALFVAQAVGIKDDMSLVNPVCLPGALAPLAASEASGQAVDLDLVWPAWRKLAETHPITIVEGVGGLLVPLTGNHLFTDLMSENPLPSLVVGRPGLGTINHTLLTIEGLERRGFPVLGFCYSHQNQEEPDESRSTNARHTGMFTDKPFFGTVPPISVSEPIDAASLARAGESLHDLIELLACQ